MLFELRRRKLDCCALEEFGAPQKKRSKLDHWPFLIKSSRKIIVAHNGCGFILVCALKFSELKNI